MRDLGLFIATLGAILVSFCSSDSLSVEEIANDEPFRMASESLVVKSYKDSHVESATQLPSKTEDKMEEFQVYQGVMGKPGVDFPVFSTIPATSFSCRGVKKSGYYADLETDCQVFHVCDRNRKISFLCPNGTIFRQSHLICDWWFRVDCGKSVELYEESAEQLAADQKVYKARSEERERRRKLSKSNKQTKSQQAQGDQQQVLPTTRQPFSYGGRKAAERHSKRVNNFGQTQEVSNSTSGEDARGQFSSQQVSNEFESIASDNYDENIFGAESGSLVEDLSNRRKNFGDFRDNAGGGTGDTSHGQINTYDSLHSTKATTKKSNANRNKSEFYSTSTTFEETNLNRNNNNEYYSSTGSSSSSSTATSSKEITTGTNSAEQNLRTGVIVVQDFHQKFDGTANNHRNANQQESNSRNTQFEYKNVNDNFETNIQSQQTHTVFNGGRDQATGGLSPQEYAQTDLSNVRNAYNRPTAVQHEYKGVQNQFSARLNSQNVKQTSDAIKNQSNGQSALWETQNVQISHADSSTTVQNIPQGLPERATGGAQIRTETTTPEGQNIVILPQNHWAQTVNISGHQSKSSNVQNVPIGAVQMSNFAVNRSSGAYNFFGSTQTEFLNKNQNLQKNEENDKFVQGNIQSQSLNSQVGHESLSRYTTQSLNFQNGYQNQFSNVQNVVPNQPAGIQTQSLGLRYNFSTVNGQGSHDSISGGHRSAHKIDGVNQQENSKFGFSPISVNQLKELSTPASVAGSTTLNFNPTNDIRSSGYEGGSNSNADSRFSTLSRPFENFNGDNSASGFNVNQNGQEGSTIYHSTTPIFYGTTERQRTNSPEYQTGSSGFVSYKQEDATTAHGDSSSSTNFAANGYEKQKFLGDNIEFRTQRPDAQQSFTGAGEQTGTFAFSYQNSNLQAEAIKEVNNNDSNDKNYQAPSESNVGSGNFNSNYGASFEGFQDFGKQKGQQTNVNVIQGGKTVQNLQVALENAKTGHEELTRQGEINGFSEENRPFGTDNRYEYSSKERVPGSGNIKSQSYNFNNNNNNNNNGGNFIRSQVSYRVKNEGTTGIFQSPSEEVSDATSRAPAEFGVKTTPFVGRESSASTTASKPEYFQTFSIATASNTEKENQFLAETAAFGSTRGGKSYSEYPSQFVLPPRHNQIESVTENIYKTTFEAGSPTAPSFQVGNAQQSTLSPYYGTPPEQSGHRTTFLPSFDTRTWPSTTPRPNFETTTASSVENIYFTTYSPPEGDDSTSGNFKFDGTIAQNRENKTSDGTSDINLSLQELNINKEVGQSNGTSKSYEDLVREGLEVPPSSGPNAIRSFALYYGTTNYTAENETSPYVLVNHNNRDANLELSSFEVKKKEIVKQVDELVQRSFANANETAVTPKEDKLPSSLTLQVQDSYLTLFPTTQEQTQTEATTEPETTDAVRTEFDFGTTNFGAFTEEPTVINSELTKNDLDESQSRGIVEPETPEDSASGRVTPDLRKLAQVFTKALSAYLDDPQAFKKALSEIRPTEPTVEVAGLTFAPNEYPSVTQEDDEVLDFSDVSKSNLKKKIGASTVRSAPNFQESATEPFAAVFNANISETENLVLPGNKTTWATNIELTAPLVETLDESQSSYYTPPAFTGRTNTVAEEINEFIVYDNPSVTEANEEVDSYLPVSTTGASNQKVGGFQNNNKKTTKYSPYGAELSTSPYPPIGLTSSGTVGTPATDNAIASLIQENTTSFYSHFSQNRTEEEEIQLAKELNNLVLLSKFTTPRGLAEDTETPPPTATASNLYTTNNGGSAVGNLAQSRTGKSFQVAGDKAEAEFHRLSNAGEIQQSPSTPKGFLITYALDDTQTVGYPSTLADQDIKPTTYSPERRTDVNSAYETVPPVYYDQGKSVPGYEVVGTSAPQPTETVRPLERIAELQETLMLNANNSAMRTDQARATAEEIIGHLNMTSQTSHTLMKMMEMAARNETYKRLVLLLVNDKSGKNKTVEEARLSLLRALLKPVITSDRTLVIPIPSRLVLAQEQTLSGNPRRSKSIRPDVVANPIVTGKPTVARTTTTTTTTTPAKEPPTTVPPLSPTTFRNFRRLKGVKITGTNPSKTELGNIEVLRRTIENSKNKQVKIAKVSEDAILNSDSRAVELLRSLYSLAARWG